MDFAYFQDKGLVFVKLLLPEREESNEKGRTQNTSNGEMNHYPDARNFQWILLTDWRMEEKLVPQWVFCLLGKPNKRVPLVPGEI